MATMTMSPSAPTITQDVTVPGKRIAMTMTASAPPMTGATATVQGGATWLVPPATVDHSVAFEVRIDPKLLPAGGRAKWSPQTITGVIRFAKSGYTDLDVTFTLKKRPGSLRT